MGSVNKETTASYHPSLLLEQGEWAMPMEKRLRPLLPLLTQMFLWGGITLQNDKCPMALWN